MTTVDLTNLQTIVENIDRHATALRKRIAWDAAHIQGGSELGNLATTIHDTSRTGSYLYNQLRDLDKELLKLCEVERGLREQKKSK